MQLIEELKLLIWVNTKNFFGNNIIHLWNGLKKFYQLKVLPLKNVKKDLTKLNNSKIESANKIVKIVQKDFLIL